MVEEEGIVSFRSKLRVVVVLLILRAGVMMNCPVRPRGDRGADAADERAEAGACPADRR